MERKEKKKKGRKKGKKRRKRERKRKKGKKRVGEAIRNEKKHGGVSSDSVYFKSLDFPLELVHLAGLLGEGPVVLFSGVSTWGSCSVTCLVQGSVGIVYPVRPKEEQPQWQRPPLETCIQPPQ